MDLQGFFTECNSYTGRWNRQKFWLYPLGMSLLVLIPLGLLFWAFIAMQIEVLTWISGAMLGIGYFYVLYVSTCAYIKRFHDLGRSGWYSLLAFVPYVGIIAVIWAGFFQGTPGKNQYGDNPLGDTGDASKSKKTEVEEEKKEL